MVGIFHVEWIEHYPSGAEIDSGEARVIANDAEEAVNKAKRHALKERLDIVDDECEPTGKTEKCCRFELVSVVRKESADF